MKNNKVMVWDKLMDRPIKAMLIDGQWCDPLGNVLSDQWRYCVVIPMQSDRKMSDRELALMFMFFTVMYFGMMILGPILTR